MEDKRRKPKLPIRNIPAVVAWILKNATQEQLAYLNKMAKTGDFSTFLNLLSRFKQYNIETVFRYEAKSEQDLFYFRAAIRGENIGLDAIVMAAQMAGKEMENRKIKKVV